MYNYLILNVTERKLHKDFLTYYKLNPCDDFYFVSVGNPDLMKYLEEFIERRMN